MGTPHPRHTRNALVNEGWALPVALQPDELLSSWLARAALTQGCDPLVLTGSIWPSWRVWARDPDRGLSKAQVDALASVSGIDTSTLHTTSLRTTAATIARGPLESYAIWPWILAQGTRNRMRHGGLQYCPICLKEDGKPYFRRQWRLAWHTGCVKHGVLLADRCTHCHAPLEPHRLSAEDGHLARCATCVSDLRQVDTLPVVESALTFQNTADDVLTTGVGVYGTTQLSPADWFELSRYFLTILRKASLTQSGKLRALIRELGINSVQLNPPATGLPLELLPVGERMQLLSALWRLLSAGPEGFRAATHAALLTRGYLHHTKQPVPASVLTLLESLPGQIGIGSYPARDKSGAPRSKQTVMRMHARLLRRMNAASR
ncbi:hypothetical protein CEW87_08865 [Parazoarcus communis]|uniref:TniQ domain-containing protein n=1 Tax=Parazoarcus communis TaxID=41977 RepID=A0A2U8H0G4_9RHOO|nr:hypothetical protein CEW87_08865 [Parazoarcus communis]